MIRYFCDWCGDKMQDEKSMRKVEFLVAVDYICLDCCKRVSKLRKEIKRDAKRGKQE